MSEEQTTQGEPIELKPGETPAASAPAPEPAPATPTPFTGKTKIVITHEKNGASVGVTRDKCDPCFFKVEGELPSIIGAVPGFLEEAIKSWATSPMNPKAPEPPPPPKVVTPAQPAAKATATKPTAPAKPAVTQQRFF